MNPLIINFFTLFFLFIIPHKYYVSTTLMDFDNKTKSFEITLKVFYDDLEKDLKLDSNKVDYIKDYDYLNEIYKPYLDQNFQINFGKFKCYHTNAVKLFNLSSKKMKKNDRFFF